MKTRRHREAHVGHRQGTPPSPEEQVWPARGDDKGKGGDVDSTQAVERGREGLPQQQFLDRNVSQNRLSSRPQAHPCSAS